MLRKAANRPIDINRHLDESDSLAPRLARVQCLGWNLDEALYNEQGVLSAQIDLQVNLCARSSMEKWDA